MKTFSAISFDKISIFIVIVVSFTYSVIMDEDLDCTCRDVFTACSLYMALPYLIFFGSTLWTDNLCLSSFKFVVKCGRGCCNNTERTARSQDANDAGVRTGQVGEANGAGDIADLEVIADERQEAPKCCGKSCCGVFGVVFIRILKAAIVGLLWVISVLIDGDWYVCCLNSKQPQLACKDKTKMTAEEQVIIAELKNESRTIGFCILLGIVCLAILMSLCDCRCCEGKGGCCDRRVIYDELILKNSDDVLMEVLSEAAKYELRQAIEEKIRDKKWTECFNVVQEIIENAKNPELPKREEENRAGREKQRNLISEGSSVGTGKQHQVKIHPSPPSTPSSGGVQGGPSQQEPHHRQDSLLPHQSISEPTQSNQDETETEEPSGLNLPGGREGDRSRRQEQPSEEVEISGVFRVNRHIIHVKRL